MLSHRVWSIVSHRGTGLCAGRMPPVSNVTLPVQRVRMYAAEPARGGRLAHEHGIRKHQSGIDEHTQTHRHARAHKVLAQIRRPQLTISRWLHRPTPPPPSFLVALSACLPVFGTQHPHRRSRQRGRARRRSRQPVARRPTSKASVGKRIPVVPRSRRCRFRPKKRRDALGQPPTSSPSPSPSNTHRSPSNASKGATNPPAPPPPPPPSTIAAAIGKGGKTAVGASPLNVSAAGVETPRMPSSTLAASKVGEKKAASGGVGDADTTCGASDGGPNARTVAGAAAAGATGMGGVVAGDVVLQAGLAAASLHRTRQEAGTAGVEAGAVTERQTAAVERQAPVPVAAEKATTRTPSAMTTATAAALAEKRSCEGGEQAAEIWAANAAFVAKYTAASEKQPALSDAEAAAVAAQRMAAAEHRARQRSPPPEPHCSQRPTAPADAPNSPGIGFRKQQPSSTPGTGTAMSTASTVVPAGAALGRIASPLGESGGNVFDHSWSAKFAPARAEKQQQQQQQQQQHHHHDHHQQQQQQLQRVIYPPVLGGLAHAAAMAYARSRAREAANGEMPPGSQAGTGGVAGIAAGFPQAPQGSWAAPSSPDQAMAVPVATTAGPGADVYQKQMRAVLAPSIWRDWGPLGGAFPISQAAGAFAQAHSGHAAAVAHTAEQWQQAAAPGADLSATAAAAMQYPYSCRGGVPSPAAVGSQFRPGQAAAAATPAAAATSAAATAAAKVAATAAQAPATPALAVPALSSPQPTHPLLGKRKTPCPSTVSARSSPVAPVSPRGERPAPAAPAADGSAALPGGAAGGPPALGSLSDLFVSSSPCSVRPSPTPNPRPSSSSGNGGGDGSTAVGARGGGEVGCDLSKGVAGGGGARAKGAGATAVASAARGEPSEEQPEQERARVATKKREERAALLQRSVASLTLLHLQFRSLEGPDAMKRGDDELSRLYLAGEFW